MTDLMITALMGRDTTRTLAKGRLASNDTDADCRFSDTLAQQVQAETSARDPKSKRQNFAETLSGKTGQNSTDKADGQAKKSANSDKKGPLSDDSKPTSSSAEGSATVKSQAAFIVEETLLSHTDVKPEADSGLPAETRADALAADNDVVAQEEDDANTVQTQTKQTQNQANSKTTEFELLNYLDKAILLGQKLQAEPLPLKAEGWLDTGAESEAAELGADIEGAVTKELFVQDPLLEGEPVDLAKTELADDADSQPQLVTVALTQELIQTENSLKAPLNKTERTPETVIPKDDGPVTDMPVIEPLKEMKAVVDSPLALKPAHSLQTAVADIKVQGSKADLSVATDKSGVTMADIELDAGLSAEVESDAAMTLASQRQSVLSAVLPEINEQSKAVVKVQTVADDEKSSAVSGQVPEPAAEEPLAMQMQVLSHAPLKAEGARVDAQASGSIKTGTAEQKASTEELLKQHAASDPSSKDSGSSSQEQQQGQQQSLLQSVTDNNSRPERLVMQQGFQEELKAASTHEKTVQQRELTQALNPQAQRQADLLGQKLNLIQPEATAQLKEQVMLMVRDKVQTAEIRLDPAELGSMQVKISMQQDQMSVQFVVQNGQTRDLMEQQMPRLRDLLQQQGIELSQGSVQQDNSSGRQASDGSGQGQNGRSGTTGHGLGTEDETAAVQVQVAVSDRVVDYYA